MVKDTQKRIEAYKAMLPGVKERIAAVALMLVVSIVMMASASYAWVTISRAPELKGMSTTIAGNGNLEIALVSPEGAQPGDATGEENSLLSSNITWGNLVNLSDSGYGLDQIALRPALLSGYNRQSTPLYGASYGEDGRVTSTSEKYSFATWKEAADGSWFFDAGNPTFGVRAIASVTYENITGNAVMNNMWTKIDTAYANAMDLYIRLINNDQKSNDNKILVSSPSSPTKVYSMDALSQMIEIYVQAQADAALGNTVKDDYSSVITYVYRMLVEYQNVLDYEGEAILQLANLQIYLSNNLLGDAYYKDVGELIAASKNNTLHNAVNLVALPTFATDYENLAKSIDELSEIAEACDPDYVTQPPVVTWSEINNAVQRLVNISTATFDGITIAQLKNQSKLDLISMVFGNNEDNKSTVIIKDGILVNTESRIGTFLYDNGTWLSSYLDAAYSGMTVKRDIYYYVFTDVDSSATSLINQDRLVTSQLDNTSTGGDAVANDTYGMAIDMWVRTNVQDVVLTLEGSLVTEMQREYGKDKNGDSAPLYTLSYDGENIDAYQLDGYWYNASSHTELGAVADMTEGYAITEKMVEVVVGYDGVNRVWEDYLSLIEAGLMAENNTTQGAGSCYVFYADPSDQTRILHLLEAFTVVFVDQEGNTLGTAKLDTDHYYSINGKTTVPLKMVTGQSSYVDENGDYQTGITALNQNEATWITALIYLDGQRLSNADVLAVGEIQGSLNIQFGSSISLENLDDEPLRNEYRDITAIATAGGSSSRNSQQPISFEYDGNAKEVTVTLMVEGEQPKKISGFFVRSISQSQGTRGETIAFTPNGDNTWSATFSLTKPGVYSMRNLIVDGSDYSLDDGTTSGLDNFPTIQIEGLGVSSIFCTLPTGITMTADNSVAATVSATINASAELMPKQVRALFRSNTGREFTALMSYDSVQGNWSGTASITESGTYTLQYLVLDGEFVELDADMQTTHIIYLGLTSQVWTTGVELEDGSFATTFEFKGAVNVDMQVKIFDRSGSELRNMEDVWLYYHSEGSVLDQDGMYGQVTWNESTGYYEGTLQLKSGGTFVFDRVVTDKSGSNPSTIRKAALSPVFLAYVTDPPEYQDHSTVDYQFVPDGGAAMNVQMTNAQTSTMWAEIKDLTSGTVYLVPCTNRVAVDMDENLYQFEFAVPTVNDKQDGSWQLVALYMQGVARPNADPNEDPIWTPVTGSDPTADDSYYMDLTGENITAYVVQTMNISITDANGNAYTGEIFGKDASGNTIGTFMQSYNTQVVTFTIKDWNGQAVQGLTGLTWQSTHKVDSADYGGYTGAYLDPPAVDLTGSGTTYTLASQTFQMAGSYTSTFTVTVGNMTLNVTGPNFQVWSKTPTVTVAGVTNTGSINTQITWTETSNWLTGKGLAYSYSNPSGLTSRVDTTTNEVWAYAAASGNGEGCGTGDAGFTRPQVTFTVAGVDGVSVVTFTIPAGAASAVSFSCTGNNSATITLGTTGTAGTKVKEVSGRFTTSTCYGYRGHGDTVQISEVTITRDGVTYTVTLEKPIIIHNPSSVDKT